VVICLNLTFVHAILVFSLFLFITVAVGCSIQTTAHQLSLSVSTTILELTISEFISQATNLRKQIE
jgi:hypothetical protein